jgi:hypothetical protein
MRISNNNEERRQLANLPELAIHQTHALITQEKLQRHNERLKIERQISQREKFIENLIPYCQKFLDRRKGSEAPSLQSLNIVKLNSQRSGASKVNK